MNIRVQNQPWYGGLAVGVFDDHSVATSIEISKLEHGMAISPLLIITREDAQLLMDDLWHCGIRPSEGQGSAGQLAAVQNHLKDLQKIVSKSLDVEL